MNSTMYQNLDIIVLGVPILLVGGWVVAGLYIGSVWRTMRRLRLEREIGKVRREMERIHWDLNWPRVSSNLEGLVREYESRRQQ